jgi:hypothetical protein
MAMSLNLIPFGYHVDTGEYLDVSDAHQGKNNGCVCPSCDTPLVARHGEVNDWHFAHASRNVYEQTSQKCEYSFFVSVRMMARQLVGNSLDINLPQYKSILEESVHFSAEKIKVPFEISLPQQITITDIAIEYGFENVVFDVVGTVDKFKFMVFFSHKGRELPEGFKNNTHSNIAIIDLALNDISRLFFQKKDSKSAYKAILFDFLQNDLNSKQWIAHPRYQSSKDKAVQKLNEFKQQFTNNGIVDYEEIGEFLERKGQSREAPRKIIEHDITNEKHSSFKCRKCKTVWRNDQSGSDDKLTCPLCEGNNNKRFKRSNEIDDKGK